MHMYLSPIDVEARHKTNKGSILPKYDARSLSLANNETEDGIITITIKPSSHSRDFSSLFYWDNLLKQPSDILKLEVS